MNPSRLVGLETEYVLHFHPHAHSAKRVANKDLFARLLLHLAAKIPLARAVAGQNSWFLANGGGLRFEHLPFYDLLPQSGFVEGATPECRRPRDVLRYQRAQDVLLSQHAASAGGEHGNMVLVKTSHDGHGHFFGSHENYEATVGTGGDLFIWRAGLILALPVIFVLLLVADVAALLLTFVLSAPAAAAYRFFGSEPGARYSAFVAWLVLFCRSPLQLFGATFVSLTAFRRVRRQLLPFLITRTIITGPGMVCRDGRFVLSPRAGGLRYLCGLTAAGGRSAFYFCQILKAINDVLLGDVPSFARLFKRRQRLQITLGESNMAQFAEYLKIATTFLVLDAIEAGGLDAAPRIRRPLKALRTISNDPSLQATVPLANGRHERALDVQRFYLNACRHCSQRHGEQDAESKYILQLWEETLDALEVDPGRLVGKLDWVTKKHLLDCAGSDAPLAARQKLDLRYHELSRDGYYLRLEAAGLAPTLVEPEEVLAAIRQPPEGSPATVRGELIRQFATSPAIRASWSMVVVPTDHGVKVVKL